MKNVIYGYHTNDKAKQIYFWEYGEHDFYSYKIKDSDYAVVETTNGLSLIKVCGNGVLKDDVPYGHKKVVQLVEVEEKKEEK